MTAVKQCILMTVAMCALSVQAAVVSNFVQDAGLESLIGTEPDAASTPWFTVGEDGAGSVTVSTDVYHSDSQALSFNWHGDLASARQSLNVFLDSSKTYEVSVWMYSYYENANQTNDADLNIALFASSDGGSSWTWLANPLFEIKNYRINTWEKFSAVIDGSDYAAYDGQLLQLRISKTSAAKYRMVVDDVEFGEKNPFSNLLQDSGFESFSGTEPDEETLPWFTIGENDPGSVTISTNVFQRGKQSISFNWQGDSATVLQKLSVALNSNKTYELSFWMYSYDEDTSQTSDADLSVSLFRSDDGGASWFWMADPLYAIQNSTSNVWEKFTTVIDGRDYAAYHGQLLELGIAKGSAARYKMAVDDVVFDQEDPVQLASNLLQDSGFESFSGTGPDDITLPWYTVGEDGDGSVTLSTNVHHSGAQSLCFNWYGDLVSARQALTALDSNKTYAVSCWMYSYDENTSQTSDADLNIALFRSGDRGVTWSWLANPLFEIKNNQTNRWEKFSAVIDGGDYAAYDGQLLELRISKTSSSRYKTAVDDVKFGEKIKTLGTVSFSRSGENQLTLFWEGDASTPYRVSASTNLVAGTWGDLVPDIAGVDGMMGVQTTMTGAQTFYRLETNHSQKKGLAIPVGKYSNYYQLLDSLNLGWFYRWGDDRPGRIPAGVEFIPMIWGIWNDKPEVYEQLISGGHQILLGFNEPDLETQSNLSVEYVTNSWPSLEATGLRLGSPGCANALGTWMQEFMAVAAEIDLRVDFVAVHYYAKGSSGAEAAAAFLQYIQTVHDRYGLPIWVTEIGIYNKRVMSPEHVYDFMAMAIPALEELNYVERYSWSLQSPDGTSLSCSALFNRDGSLTELGKLYSSY